MHKVQSARPSPALRRYVRAYAQREVQGCSAPVIEPVPARSEQILDFEFRDPYELRFDNGERRGTHTTAVIGYQTYRRCDIVMSGSIESFAVFFQPAGFSHIFKTPIRDLTNQIHEAGSVLGRAYIRCGLEPANRLRSRAVFESWSNSCCGIWSALTARMESPRRLTTS
jgi:hypothetical protein